eukprot:193613_1
MEQFVDSLLKVSDQWITTTAVNDRSIFKSVLKKVLSELPSPFNALSNNATMMDSLWAKIQIKYASSSNHKRPFFFSETDITQYLKHHKSTSNTQKALLSNKATLKHYSNAKLNPFFKPYQSIDHTHINHLLDRALANNECNDECLSFIQFRFNLFLSNKLESHKRSNKTIRVLSQKLYRLFCHNLARKCIDNQDAKLSVALCFNRILLLCKDDRVCKDVSVNIMSFIRVFLDHNQDSKSLEAIRRCMNVELLIRKLLECIVTRCDSMNHWSNTQRLIFLWTVYECNQNDCVGDAHVRKLLQWSEKMWSFNELLLVFSDKSIESFADFANGIYKHNMLSTVPEEDGDEEDDAADIDDYDDEDSELDMDIMDVDKQD